MGGCKGGENIGVRLASSVQTAMACAKPSFGQCPKCKAKVDAARMERIMNILEKSLKGIIPCSMPRSFECFRCPRGIKSMYFVI